jgi:hypothetical protein
LPTLLITYDLNKEKSKDDYAGFYKVIKRGAWTRLTDSTYAVHTDASPTDIYNQLRPYVDDDDAVFVITLGTPWAGLSTPAAIQWLQTRLRN